jgi:PIN domain nuclease of toxin-antitoxin system
VASVTYLDTHVVAWLFAQGVRLFPSEVVERMRAADELRISPMVRLELQYLFEIGRVTRPAASVLGTVSPVIGLEMCRAPFEAVVRDAEAISWTRDPFDRLIVAQAALYQATLLTRDEIIRKHFSDAFWPVPPR